MHNRGRCKTLTCVYSSDHLDHRSLCGRTARSWHSTCLASCDLDKNDQLPLAFPLIQTETSPTLLLHHITQENILQYKTSVLDYLFTSTERSFYTLSKGMPPPLSLERQGVVRPHRFHSTLMKLDGHKVCSYVHTKLFGQHRTTPDIGLLACMPDARPA